MAIVFILALLVDSACAAACIPAELQAPPEHCSSGDHGAESPERGCDLHGHLKPVLKDRGWVATTTMTQDALAFQSPASTPSASGVRALETRDADRNVPPLLQRTTVLRI